MRLQRALERDGEHMLDAWINDWMPAEDHYLAVEHPDERADLRIDGTNAEAWMALYQARPGIGMSTSPIDPKAIVKAGYDALGESYLTWSSRVEGDPRGLFLAEFMGRLQPGARVLDLGCGPGVPSTERLAQHFEVVGVDLSATQLDIARRKVPGATFVQSDISDLSFAPASFAGVTAFYSIPHVPRAEHEGLFRRVATWLEPGGLFLATLGAGDLPDWEGDWLGVPMFFSSSDADTNRDHLGAAGLELIRDEVVAMREPEGEVAFLWTLARKFG